ncbi:hypothetical protein B0A53_02123 [Rhodotorula sp. CCFEE 5036]|nr:hypothetical protein B0A53_02123 [Rhodotorula sp. CCFEE 5036]
MAPNKLGRTRGPQTNSRDVFAAARLRAQASASTPPAATPLTSGGSQLRAATSDAGRSGAVLATATAAGPVAVLTAAQDALLDEHPFVVPVTKALHGKGNAAERVAKLERLKATFKQDLDAHSANIDFDPHWDLVSMIRMDHPLKERMFVAKGFALLDLAESADEGQ